MMAAITAGPAWAGEFPPPPPPPDNGGNGHHHNNNNNNNDPRNNGTLAFFQESEQDVESGDAIQNINVTGGGDNSNQCAGVQGITNTGNATNNTGVLQFANNDAEVEVDDSANFQISPSQTTTCTQQVNQAVVAN
jgi:hypothetical protein